MSVTRRQALLACFLDDPELERRVREDPEGVAREREVPIDWVRWLASIEPRRIRSFRISRRVKQRRRDAPGGG